jgi:chromosome segregation ATPase
VKKTPGRARDDDGKGADALRASLDALEENITLLLAQHESLAAHAADVERHRSQGAIDPIELEKRVGTLEADKERLERHSAFLEERIRGLLSRVRYVIES